MCGINGIFAYHYAASTIDRQELRRTRDHMARRGPDGTGEWISEHGRIGIGHRRLAIIDLTESGAQPMASVDGKHIVTFNGEIYNYKELRKGLEARGRIFHSESDTEVLLHLYAEKGEEMVRDLRGMFAFGVWDGVTNSLFLARDPYGIKPLYYSNDGRTLRFASQVKALVAGGGCGVTPDPAGWAGFHIFGNVPEPFTIYRDIRALPAGSTLIVNCSGRCEPRRYHSIASVYSEAEVQPKIARSARERHHAIRSALLDSVRHHLVADVPVGAFLSAGIDSGALVGLMRDAGQSEIATVTLAFEDFKGGAHDEAPLAALVAQKYGTRHTTRIVAREEFHRDLPLILDAMDQPSIDGINTWFVSKAAHELGLKVAVSGIGGDELFGGYPSFDDIPRWVQWLALPSRAGMVGPRMRKVVQTLLRAGKISARPKVLGLFEYGAGFAGAYLLRRGLFMPWELEEVMDSDVACEGLRCLAPVSMIEGMLQPRQGSSFAKVAALEASIYLRNQLLRDTDWASMAHSLEVRTPLVDAFLLRLVAEQGDLREAGRPKRALAESPSVALPQAILSREKTGFGTPVEAWMGTCERGPALRSIGRSRRWACRIAASAGIGLSGQA